MCGIVGFCNYKDNYIMDEAKYRKHIELLKKMHLSISHRGDDQCGEYLNCNVGLGHTRLSIRDVKNGMQPMKEIVNGKTYVIVYNGEIYNTKELRTELEKRGHIFETNCDTEVILKAYIEYGIDCINMLNGIFAFAVYDESQKRLVLVRDRVGVKPLFYTIKENELIFASEIKGLFSNPKVEAKINMDSFREIFGVGPARTPGNGVFCEINEMKPGHYAIFNQDGFKQCKYWDIEAKEHTDSYEDTVYNVRFLLEDSINRQMISDVGVCTFLSGGIDSTIVTAIAAKNNVLNTFSFDFTGNDKYFVSNSFQPERDAEYVNYALKHIKTNHNYLFCDDKQLYESLFKSVEAKDLPGMADVDASLLYFCSQVRKENVVALTGECADEIFGGYPWFYREDLLKGEGFPWSKNTDTRELLLQKDFARELKLSEYARYRYEESIKQVPLLYGENAEEKKRREIGYLNIRWFMQTLLDRMDRASMYNGLEARVPFADHRIIEYVYNVPWSMKRRNNVEKSLLRDAFKDVLPERLLNRKKSPYPKTYSPFYEELLKKKILQILDDNNSPIHVFIDKRKVLEYIKEPTLYGKPWFGQLMAAPQLLAYLIQIDYWISIYKPTMI
ncbi:MAG: asparagine synthase (glutamine-hydrolyzing) [Lachnospiraceae bacterium]|nr:asparagine synthase (glutamine-hydrolyzing) [Lachnospiraceae bacterium]